MIDSRLSIVGKSRGDTTVSITTVPAPSSLETRILAQLDYMGQFQVGGTAHDTEMSRVVWEGLGELMRGGLYGQLTT